MHRTTRRSPSPARRLRRVAPLAALLVALFTSGLALATAPIASACPPQGCGHEPNPDPTPHPPYTPAPKYRVTLQTIHPIKTQDANVDQVYAVLSGKQVTGTANLSNLSHWNLNVTREIPAPLWIELWDQDWDYPFVSDTDDSLGVAYLSKPALGASYTQTIRLYGSGAIYDLTVKVARIA